MRILLPLLIAALACGCAKFPSAPVQTETRITFKFKVDGKIRTGTGADENGLPYTYMVAIRPSQDDNPTEQGPIPVIAPPWGNGFVAGTCTHFVWWSPQFFPNYTLYQFTDATMNQYRQLGSPVTFTDLRPGGDTLEFSVDLNQIEPDADVRAKIKSLQVNFLAMDRIPTGGLEKLWEALGDGRLPTQVNSPVIIPLRVSATYDNKLFNNLEPLGDQPDPDLDIVDWSVEVRLP